MNETILQEIITILKDLYIGDFTIAEEESKATIAHKVTTTGLEIGATYTMRSFSHVHKVAEDMEQKYPGAHVFIWPDPEPGADWSTKFIMVEIRTQKSYKETV